MGRITDPNKCKTAGDFNSYLNRNGFREMRQTGSHRIYAGPDGNGRIIVPQHNGDIPTGTRGSIVKAIMAVMAVAAMFICGITGSLVPVCEQVFKLIGLL
jgi:predicted RNA binding protein YcfA (HicA-like mRNA interferase family)